MSDRRAGVPGLFAIVDCAAAEWLHPVCLAEAGRSLYAGALQPDLAAATPHLVPLPQGSLLLARLDGPEARAAHCAILCESALTPWDLRLWLRPRLQAMLPDGEVVLFRFHDPRLFPAWLDSLSPEDLQGWFGPVTRWWVPLADRTICFALEGGQLARRILPVARPA